MKATKLMALAAALLMSTHAGAAVLRIGLKEDPDMLDPHKARTYVGRIVFTSLCDKLVDISPKLDFVPQLATSWSWSDDKKALTFKLRPDVTFQDGTKFDAEAVKKNIDRAMTLPDSNRKSELTSVDHVEVVDPLTVTFHLKHPDATLLATLSDRAGMMLAPSAFEGGKDFAQNPVCSGPYKLVKRVQNDRIELTKYKGYWDAKDYPLDGVTFLPITDATVKLANLRSGDIDMLERLAPSDVPSVKKDANLQFVPVTGLGYMSIYFNVGKGERAKTPIGQDKRIRQAFQDAIGRDVIDQVAGNGIYPPAQQPFPPSSPYNSDKFPVTQRDVAKAKALLKEAGVEHPTVELVYGTGTDNQQVVELIQAMASEAGFDVKLRATEFATMLDEMDRGNYQAGYLGWSGRVDPDGNIHPFLTCKGNLNDSGYCNKDVDAALDAARETTEVDKRKALYDKAQATLQDDLPMMYLYHQPWPFALSKHVTGFVPYPDGMIRLKGMNVTK